LKNGEPPEAEPAEPSVKWQGIESPKGFSGFLFFKIWIFDNFGYTKRKFKKRSLKKCF